MNELDALELKVQAVQDQVCAVLREKEQDIHAIADRDPNTWTNKDAQVIRMTLYAVLGFLKSGRL